MHILQSFCIAMFLVLFRHNKTPKVFCLTFGVHVKIYPPIFKNKGFERKCNRYSKRRRCPVEAGHDYTILILPSYHVFTTGSTALACYCALREVFPPSVRISIATLGFVGQAWRRCGRKGWSRSDGCRWRPFRKRRRSLKLSWPWREGDDDENDAEASYSYDYDQSGN